MARVAALRPMIARRPRSHGPSLLLDLYSRDALLDPQDVYRRIRDAGAAVWLPRHRMWAMGRYGDVRDALRDADTFGSGRGVAANRLINHMSEGTTLASDGQIHTKRRQLLLQSLSAKALAEVVAALDAEASALIRGLLELDVFDGVADFASRLPVRVIADLVGVDIDHSRMLKWGRAGFDALGPANHRFFGAFRQALSFYRYAQHLGPANVKPGGWAASLLAPSDEGVHNAEERKAMVVDFIGPSLDTTILAAAQLLWELGANPAVWQELRADPTLVPSAIMEAVRVASPVRGFTRIINRDTEIDGSVLRAGQRVVLLYASANMDETQFEEPQKFSLHRMGGNLGWGFGAHACVGMHLSKLEISALLRAMIPAVARIDVSEPVPLLNNTLQGLEGFRAALHG
jgi:cytochrome P450